MIPKSSLLFVWSNSLKNSVGISSGPGVLCLFSFLRIWFSSSNVISPILYLPFFLATMRLVLNLTLCLLPVGVPH